MNTTFGIGQVLGTGLKVWIKNLLPFSIMTAIVLIPHLLWGLHYADQLPDIAAHATSKQDAQMGAIVAGLPGAGLLAVLTILLISSLTYGVVMELQGQGAGFFAAIGRGVARLFPTLGVAVLVIICTFGGAVLLVLPGIMLWCGLYVAVPASVIEKPGLFGALRRSFELTRGHRMEIFALGVIVVMVNAVLNKVLEMTVAPAIDTDGAKAELIFSQFRNFIWADYIHNILAVSLQASLVSVAYYLLRAEKEGVTADHLAQVFA